MRHPLTAKLAAATLALAYASILSGCWWGRREPRHDDRVVVVKEEHHDDRR
jgi:hypothetical protein